VLWVLVQCCSFRTHHPASLSFPSKYYLQILGAGDLIDAHALGAFLARCQYKFGGIGKAPGEHPGKPPNVLGSRLDTCVIVALFKDPYHTYLSIAAAAIVSPDPQWDLQPLDPLINATPDTARWAKTHVSGTAAPEI